MAWDVAFHDEFVPEFKAFEASVQDGLLAVAKLLADCGPQLGRPHADTLKGSKRGSQKRFYRQLIAKADSRFSAHVEGLKAGKRKV